MQSNPHVYPFVPFEDLTNKEILDRFGEPRTETAETIRSLLNAVVVPEPTVHGETREEKILSVFLDDQYRFGPRELIEEESDQWKQKIRFFVERNEPLYGIILGFPFKMPVPLKTNRTLPDMGELLMLHRLWTITQQVKKIFEPGMRIEIFSEGVFGEFTEITEDAADAYRERAKAFLEIFGYAGNISITDLKELQKRIPDFDEHYERVIEEVRQRFEAGDEDVRAQYEATYPSVFRIVPAVRAETHEVMDVYNESIPDAQLSPRTQAIRADMQSRTHEAIIRYLAYHRARKKTGMMDLVEPHALYLTVTPKRGRLGVFPVAQDISRLPYHAVAVWHAASRRFTLEYLIDLRRRNGPFTPVHLEGDLDPEPFFYEAND